MKPGVIEIKETEGTEVKEVVGLCLTKSQKVSMKVARREWEHAIRAEMMMRGMTDEQWENEPFVAIELACGGKVIYQTFDDIPCESVPCSCGNPKHWFVKYMEEVSNV